MPKFQIERSLKIEAPASAVFPKVYDFKRWPEWSPWILAEPKCKLNFAKDGKSYSWEGDIIGSGEMELLEMKQHRELHYRLTFLKPFKSTSSVSFYLDERDGETDTKWTMSGGLPFFLFWMKKAMVASVGMDYDRGLNMLKDLVEQGCVPSVLSFPGLEPVKGFRYLGIRSKCSLRDIGAKMKEDFERLETTLASAGISGISPPVCFYHSFKITSGVTDYSVAVPVGVGSECPAGLVTGSVPDLQTYAIEHQGPYRHLGNAWAAGMMHSRAKLFSQSKSFVPFEVFESDPKTVDEDRLLTKVHFPI